MEKQQRERHDECRRDEEAGWEVAAIWKPRGGGVSRIGELAKAIALREIASMKLLDVAFERINEQVARVAVGAFDTIQFGEVFDQQVAVVDVSQCILRLFEKLNRVAEVAQAGRVGDFERIAKLLRSNPNGVDAFGKIDAARAIDAAAQHRCAFGHALSKQPFPTPLERAALSAVCRSLPNSAAVYAGRRGTSRKPGRFRARGMTCTA